MSENKKTYKRITTNSLFEMKSNNEKTDIVKLPTLALEREKEMNAPL